MEDTLMTHLLLVALVILDCAGIGVLDAAAVVSVVDVVGVELVLSDVALLLECPPKTMCLLKNMCPLKVPQPLLLSMHPLNFIE